MLVYAIIVDDGDVTRFPVVAYSIVDLITRAVQKVKRGFVDMAVLLRLGAGGIFFQMDMESLGNTVFRFNVVFAKSLGTVDEFELAALAYAGLGAQALQLRL